MPENSNPALSSSDGNLGGKANAAKLPVDLAKLLTPKDLDYEHTRLVEATLAGCPLRQQRKARP